MTSIHCSFRLSQADFVALHHAIRKRLNRLSNANKKLFFLNILIWLPFGAGVFAYTALYQNYPELAPDLNLIAAMLGVGIALMVAGGFCKQRIYLKIMLAPESWFLAEQRLNLDSAGLAATGTYGEVHYPWSAFIDHTEDANNLYLFTDNAQAFTLPKVAVGSPAQLAQIKAWLIS